MDAGVVIPWFDSGCEHRKVAFKYVKDHYEKHFPVFTYEADEPQQRASLRNQAVEASPFDVVAVIDADVFISPAQVAYAMRWSAEDNRLTKPYFVVGYMSKSATVEWTSVARSDISEEEFRRLSLPWDGIHGGAFVLPRRTWLQVGGMDEGFEGWGGEDNAFNFRCAGALGRVGLVRGFGLHLYHPRPGKMSDQNRERLLTYVNKDSLLPPYSVRKTR